MTSVSFGVSVHLFGHFRPVLGPARSCTVQNQFLGRLVAFSYVGVLEVEVPQRRRSIAAIQLPAKKYSADIMTLLGSYTNKDKWCSVVS